MGEAVDLAILVPVLRRPQRVKPLLESIEATTPKCRVLFIADADDEEEIRAIDDACPMPARPTSEPIYGHDFGALTIQCMALEPPVNWARKTNAGYHATTEPFIFIGADDIEPQPGWYEKAMAEMQPGIGIVGTNDGANPRTFRGEHATHMLIRRSYIEEHSGVVDEPNTVIHEGYPHEYGDDELIQTAIARGMYAHAHDSIVLHLHPIVGDNPGKLPDDDTYRLGRSQTRLGRNLFRHRMKLWQRLQSQS